MGKKRIIYILGTYLFVCVYSTQNKQTKCLVKTEHVPVLLKIINGHIGAALGELRYERTTGMITKER